jgi:hypothetical protein
MVSGGIYELTYSSSDVAWKLPSPDDGRTYAEIAAGVTPTNYQYLAPNILRYGAVDDGTTDCTTAINNALAANDYALIPEPASSFQINTMISVPDNKGVVGFGLGSVIKKGANIAMFSLGRYSYLNSLYLDGNGGTYTGVGVTIPYTAEFEGFQHITNCKIYDTTSYNIQYVSGAKGAGFNSRVISCQLRTVSDAVACIKWGNDPTNSHGERSILNCTAGSGCLVDCDNADNGFIIGNTAGDGGGLAAIIYGSTSSKIIAVGNRFAASATTIIQGTAHTFVGNVHAAGITLASGTNDCHIGNNVCAGTITDSSGAQNQLDINLRAYTSTWTGSGSNPAIGDGTSYAFETREGCMISVDLGINMGSTTTYGTGEYRFSLPRAASGSSNFFGGTALLYDLSATTYYTGVVQIAASGTYLTVLVHNTVSTITPTVPFTFANGDFLRIQASYST